MRNVCVDRVYEEKQRDEILKRLREVVEKYEERIVPPKAVLRSEKCNCGCLEEEDKDVSQTVTLDGQEGRPNKHKKQGKIQWKPPYRRTQPKHDKMPCSLAPSVYPPTDHTCDDMNCCCGKAAGGHQHYTKHCHGSITDAVDDYCTMGVDFFPCPDDKNHKHWSPKTSNCKWPAPCPADCFEHPDIRDWIDNIPTVQRGERKQQKQR